MLSGKSPSSVGFVVISARSLRWSVLPKRFRAAHGRARQSESSRWPRHGAGAECAALHQLAWLLRCTGERNYLFQLNLRRLGNTHSTLFIALREGHLITGQVDDVGTRFLLALLQPQQRRGSRCRPDRFKDDATADELRPHTSEAIEQALQKLAREGLIVDTGRRRWSKRTRSYQIVWAKAPGAEF